MVLVQRGRAVGAWLRVLVVEREAAVEAVVVGLGVVVLEAQVVVVAEVEEEEEVVVEAVAVDDFTSSSSPHFFQCVLLSFLSFPFSYL